MATEMKIRRMSNVQLQEVAWLWKPYIPFGKITIIQGDPDEGKSMAFNLGNDAGFYWIDGYEDISSEDILSGFGVTAETKTAQAE